MNTYAPPQPKADPPDPTQGELRLLHFFVIYRRGHGVSPTLTEAGENLGVRRSLIHKFSQSLHRKGWLEWRAGYTRNYRPTDHAIQLCSELRSLA